jgi:hypothetical protein
LLSGVERSIQQPLGYEQQQERYSGEKTHSVKKNILSLPILRIMYLSKTINGSVNEKRISDEQPCRLTQRINLW